YACGRAPARADSAFGARRQGGGGLFGAPRAPDARARPSADGKVEALVRNFNVVVRTNQQIPRSARDDMTPSARDEIQLSTDGCDGDAYDPPPILWSPDSKRIAAYRVRPGYRREVHYVQSSPEDQLQP